MKKFVKGILSILLIVCCLVSAVACGGNKITIKKLEKSLSDGEWQFTVQKNDDNEYDFEYVLSSEKTYRGKADKRKNVYYYEVVCNNISNTYLLENPKRLESALVAVMQMNPTGIDLDLSACVISVVEIETAISKEYGKGAFTYEEMKEIASIFSGKAKKIDNWSISSIIDEDAQQVIIKAELNK